MFLENIYTSVFLNDDSMFCHITVVMVDPRMVLNLEYRSFLVLCCAIFMGLSNIS